MPLLASGSIHNIPQVAPDSYPVPPIYSVRVAMFALTLVHILFSAVIISLNWPIETMNIGSDDINGRHGCINIAEG